MNRYIRIKKMIISALINTILKGTRVYFFELKRRLLNWAGYQIGKGTKIVGPIEWPADVTIGENCWIGKNCKANGNGAVVIGDNCDLGPEVTFQTGGHKIGDTTRRAGQGETFHQVVGSGTWIGGRSTICNNVSIGAGCVVAGCACVIHDVPDNTLVGGVPAKFIRRLDE